jgi:hypothetical protein
LVAEEQALVAGERPRHRGEERRRGAERRCATLYA